MLSKRRCHHVFGTAVESAGGLNSIPVAFSLHDVGLHLWFVQQQSEQQAGIRFTN